MRMMRMRKIDSALGREMRGTDRKAQGHARLVTRDPHTAAPRGYGFIRFYCSIIKFYLWGPRFDLPLHPNKTLSQLLNFDTKR